jgi:phage terminase Nu1 subunit (DNA packaging protein)
MSSTTYPVSVIAKLFNMTERRVQQLAARGVIPKANRGQYDLVACVRGYISFLQACAFNKDTKNGDILDERRRLVKAQAEKTELEVKTLKKELLFLDDIEEEWSGLVIAFRSRLLTVPTRAAHLVIGRYEFHEIERSLKELVYETLTELSAYAPPTT